MNGLVKIEIAVDEATARALTNTHRLRAIDRMVPPVADDPVAAVLEATASDAEAAGLGDAEIDAELTVYNAERRD